jgi:hypothetical protein
MTSLLFSIIVAALLSITSFIAVVFRVSPLTSPGQALTAFFASIFLSVASVATLLLFVLWKWFPIHAWDEGKILSISLRQGIFLGAATTILVLFHLLGLLTWWIVILIYLVFLLIELALQH